MTDAPELKRYIKPSVVIERGGRKIGIIGYVTTDTPKIANPGPIKFKKEIPEIDAEAKRLKAQGVNILIALGHSGYTMDKQIAKEVPDIDVVVGGHTNTFLSSDLEPPSKEAIAGQYPTLITQPGMKGKIVPVVQA